MSLLNRDDRIGKFDCTCIVYILVSASEPIASLFLFDYNYILIVLIRYDY